MDPLEEHIKTLNKAMQSVEKPDSLAIWKGIERSKPAAPLPFYKRKLFWVAAAIVVALWGALLTWKHVQTREKDATLIAQLPDEWQIQARTYQLLIHHREQQLQKAQTDHAAIVEELQVLRELDQMQANFLSDFEALPKDERTAARYVRYYEQKMRIMELIIKKIDIQKYETERNIQQAG